MCHGILKPDQIIEFSQCAAETNKQKYSIRCAVPTQLNMFFPSLKTMTPPPKVPLSFNFHPQSLVFQRQGSNGVIWWQWISRRWRRTEHSWSSPPKVHLIIVCWRFPRLSVKTTQGSSGNYREWGFPLLPLRLRFIRSMKTLQFILFSILLEMVK